MNPIVMMAAVLAANTTVIDTPQGVVAVTPVEGNGFTISRPAPGQNAPEVFNSVRPRSWNDARVWAFQGEGYTLYIDRSNGAAHFVTLQGDTLLSETAPMKFRHNGAGFYGAGERGHSLRLNGDTLVQYNRPNYGYGEGDPRISQMGITMPYLLSDRGYGLLFNDDSKSWIAFPQEDVVTYTTVSRQPVSYTFIGGSDMPKAVENFTRIAGRQDLPPFWALGYITSKYGYHTDREALGAIDSLKNAGYPVDGIVFDLYWYGKETDMGRLEWNRDQFPNPQAMLDSMKRMHVNPVLIHQPYINQTGALDNYKSFRDKGLLTRDSAGKTADVHTWVGDAGMFDMAQPATRQWLWNRLHGLTAQGVSGWWGDLGEPEVHPDNILHANGLGTVDYHNRYGNDWSRMIYEGLRRDFPEMRPFLLMRGGTTGLQQYSVFPWTGDVARSWEGLQPQIKLFLNSGLSGLGYMSSDIGGFAVDKSHPSDPELYVRWMQLGVFNPVLRTHAQYMPEPYHYPKESKILLDLVKIRYRWLPYNYTLAYENAAYGQPLARPLNYYSNETAAEDEYYWGSEVLVAPVMKAGAKTRKVLFPQAGTTWIDWFTGRRYKGGSSANVPVTLSTFPLFVKAGAFIPQYDRPIDNVTEYDPAYLTVRYFADTKPSRYVLFDDNRLSPTSLKDHQYVLTTFKADGKGTFTISPVGTYAEAPKVRHLTLQLIGVSRPAKIVTATDGATAAKASATATPAGTSLPFTYDARTRTVTLTLDLAARTPLSFTLK